MGISNYKPNSRLAQAGVVPNAAARPASPYEGQVIFQVDTKRTLVWDGAGWVDLSTGTANQPGLELIKTQTLSGTATNCENCFSDKYENYRIVVNKIAFNATGDLYIQMLNGSTAITGSNYQWMIQGIDSAAAATPNTATNLAQAYTGVSNNGANNIARGSLSMDVYSPKLPLRTFFTLQAITYVVNQSAKFGGIHHTLETAYDGIRFLTTSATTVTGFVSIYGYRN